MPDAPELGIAEASSKRRPPLMQVITKLLYLQHQGEAFTKVCSRGVPDAPGGSTGLDWRPAVVQKEATEVFFAVTKLFQNADMHLRRMVYLCLKDICPDADEVMIVTNSLMKDMNAPQELYRANAIRVLRSIIDGSVLQASVRA
jgi:coatomer subunit gamma